MSNDYDRRLSIIGPKESIAAIKVAADNRDGVGFGLFSEYIPYYDKSWIIDRTDTGKIGEYTLCWEINFIGYGQFNIIYSSIWLSAALPLLQTWLPAVPG